MSPMCGHPVVPQPSISQSARTDDRLWSGPCIRHVPGDGCGPREPRRLGPARWTDSPQTQGRRTYSTPGQNGQQFRSPRRALISRRFPTWLSCRLTSESYRPRPLVEPPRESRDRPTRPVQFGLNSELPHAEVIGAPPDTNPGASMRTALLRRVPSARPGLGTDKRALAALAAGSLAAAGLAVAITPTANAAEASYTIWSSTAPKVAADSDTAKVTLGVQFSSTSAGSVNGVRYYGTAQNSGRTPVSCGPRAASCSRRSLSRPRPPRDGRPLASPSRSLSSPAPTTWRPTPPRRAGTPLTSSL